MKKKIVFAVLILCLGLMGCTKKTAPQPEKVVIATHSAVYDWAKNVIGESKGINLKLAKSALSDFHSYTPTKEEVAELSTADLVLCVGTDSENWLLDCVEREKLMPMSEHSVLLNGISYEDKKSQIVAPAYDEHIWLSLKNAEKCTNALVQKFSDLVKSNTDEYKANGEMYVKKIQSLNEQFKAFFHDKAGKTFLFAGGFPFSYIFKEYEADVKITGLCPAGGNDEYLEQLLNELKPDTVYASSGTKVNTKNPVKIKYWNPMHKGEVDYLQEMAKFIYNE